MSPSSPDVAGDFEGVGWAACLCLAGVNMSFVWQFDPRVCWYFVERPRIFTLKHLDRKAVWRPLRDMGYGSSHPDLLASFCLPLLRSHTHIYAYACISSETQHVCTYSQLKQIIVCVHYIQNHAHYKITYSPKLEPRKSFTAQVLLYDMMESMELLFVFYISINLSWCRRNNRYTTHLWFRISKTVVHHLSKRPTRSGVTFSLKAIRTLPDTTHEEHKEQSSRAFLEQVSTSLDMGGLGCQRSEACQSSSSLSLFCSRSVFLSGAETWSRVCGRCFSKVAPPHFTPCF